VRCDHILAVYISKAGGGIYITVKDVTAAVSTLNHMSSVRHLTNERKEMLFYLGDEGFSYFKHGNLLSIYICFLIIRCIYRLRDENLRQRRKAVDNGAKGYNKTHCAWNA
jgi:hypothetical protein